MPTEVEIAIGAPAARLVILHTTNFPCEKGAKVGEYELRYADGTSAKIDIRYGENIRAYNDISAAPGTPSLWTGRTNNGEPVTLSGLVWDHPGGNSWQTACVPSANPRKA